MFKFVVLAACVFGANAGLIAAPVSYSAGTVSYAAGPVLSATLLGRTTVNAPETTIVKQPVIVDQPEIHYRSVPTIVQTAPVVQTIAAAPAIAAVRTVAAPIALQAPAVRTISAPLTLQAPSVISAPIVQGNTIQTIATPYAAHSQLIAGIQSNTILASPTSTLLALKK